MQNKNGLVVSDTGPIFSLVIIDKLDILNSLFEEVKIPNAVWEELTLDKTSLLYDKIYDFFESKIVRISGSNDLKFIMDYGESEAIILYRELQAEFLLIDDRKARKIAENMDVKCIGTIGILGIARRKGIIRELKPLFEIFLKSDRYYSLKILNLVLMQCGEEIIKR